MVERTKWIGRITWCLNTGSNAYEWNNIKIENYHIVNSVRDYTHKCTYTHIHKFHGTPFIGTFIIGNIYLKYLECADGQWL